MCIEAPCEAIADVPRRHEQVRALFDNGRLYRFALDQEGRMCWRYEGDRRWTALPGTDAAAPLSRLEAALWVRGHPAGHYTVMAMPR